MCVAYAQPPKVVCSSRDCVSNYFLAFSKLIAFSPFRLRMD